MTENTKRTRFPNVFWVANGIEIFERFAYSGIYMGFGIYMQAKGYSMGELGIIQSIFLLFSYLIPVISGTLADQYGFKKILIVSYLAYLPSILLLIITDSFSGIALAMLCIGLAAGIFKPLIAGTVRLVTDKSNKTLGFGIFYAMVNIGATFGPLVAGYLRKISWSYAFYAAAIGIGIMLLITIFFYKEPEKKVVQVSLGKKLKEILTTLADTKFSLFLLLLGVFFWLPFWAFFNLLGLYIDQSLNTVQLYVSIKSVLGTTVANFLSHEVEGQRRILGETIANTGYYIIIFQILVSRISEKFQAMPSFLFGLFVAAGGFTLLGVARISHAAIGILGIALFAIGEMISSPRIQEYITWLAPKEKAGLYMGSNFLATAVGAFFSGVTYTSLFGYYKDQGHPEYVWYTLAAHMIVGIAVIYFYMKKVGDFKEQDE